MLGTLSRKTMVRNAALCLAIGTGLALNGCNRAPEITLPADQEESAALCYGATLAAAQEKQTGPITLDVASQAAHFVLLGGSFSGVGEPTKVDSIGARGKAFQQEFANDKNAAAYVAPCAKAFPETQAGMFKALPPDSPDTRMMCYTLSTALLQIFAGSEIAPDPRATTYARLNGTLEQSLQAEVEAAGKDLNPAELAGRAMRGLAQAVRLGPPVDVMRACGDRFLRR